MISRSSRTAAYSALLFVGLGIWGFAQTPAATNIVGGRGGTQFSDTLTFGGARVFEVHIYSGEFVDSLQMIYLLPDGRTQPSSRRGGSGGRQNIFRLDSDEYIVGLSGRYGNYIDSIRIHTNKRVSPLYGGAGGSQEYRINVAPGNHAVGFAGRAGNHLDAVGLLYAPIYVAVTRTETYGGRGGVPFSDTDIPLGANISEVRIYAGNNIDGIQTVYTLQDGRIMEGPMRGGTGGRRDVFRLDPGEYIIGISGRYGNYVDSLTLRTNKRTSQIFGGRGGDRDYQIDVPSGTQALGFTGRAGKYLDAIGLNYAPVSAAGRDQQWRRPQRFRVQD